MSVKEIALQFFNAYRTQNVEQMATLFNQDATIRYVPFGDAGIGGIEEAGIATWKGLIDAFPDLTNEVKNIWQDDSGKTAFVEVYIGGTQNKDAFGIANEGNRYWLEHLFIIQINEQGSITKLTSYWDNAEWYRQLGEVEIAA